MKTSGSSILACQKCPRLAEHLREVEKTYPEYHCRPVLPFGAQKPKLFIVGLAPGLHGANRSGRPFTGDFAGILLYETLFRHGFANKPKSVGLADGFKLRDCLITNAVKCLPPQNKPLPVEVKTCNPYLSEEIKALPQRTQILALGHIAHQAVLLALGLKKTLYHFANAASHSLPQGHTLWNSYHCSRYNTQTRRLTSQMFEALFEKMSQAIVQNPSE